MRGRQNLRRAMVERCILFAVDRPQMVLFTLHGWAICPEKQERINEDQINIAGHYAKGGIDYVIGQIIGMPNHAVDAFLAHYAISYQHSFDEKMQQSSDCQSCKSRQYWYPTRRAEQNQCECDNDDDIPEIAPIEAGFPCAELFIHFDILYSAFLAVRLHRIKCPLSKDFIPACFWRESIGKTWMPAYIRGHDRQWSDTLLCAAALSDLVETQNLRSGCSPLRQNYVYSCPSSLLALHGSLPPVQDGNLAH